MAGRWKKHDMEFLGGRRLRRLRRTPWMRDLVRETVLTPADLIWPLFVIEGTRELLETLIQANALQPDDLASAIFTVTPDLTRLRAFLETKTVWHTKGL